MSINDIQKAAGISRGTFYYYFASKEECFETSVKYDIDGTKADTLTGCVIPLHEYIVSAIDKLSGRSEACRTLDRISFLYEARKIIPDLRDYLFSSTLVYCHPWPLLVFCLPRRRFNPQFELFE